MVRGIERRAIFQDDADRRDFVARLAAVTAPGAWEVYAWALLPNHLHLLVRTGRRPLGRTLGSLLAGYAGAFNRRHHRHGHLFQNRYRSIVVEECQRPPMESHSGSPHGEPAKDVAGSLASGLSGPLRCPSLLLR